MYASFFRVTTICYIWPKPAVMNIKHAVPALALLLTFSATAQFKKGQRMLGATIGSVFFNSSTADVSFPPPTSGYTTKTTHFGLLLSPMAGQFVNDNIVV